MKKFIAILLMMTMLFSCTAMAEITKGGTKTVMQLQINPALVADADDKTTALLIETLNDMTFTVVEGGELTELNIGANGVDFLELGLTADETGALLTFCSLYPNIAVKYDLSKLVAMLNDLVGEEVQAAMTQGMAMGEQLVSALAGYVEDVMALSALMESEAIVDEAAGTVQINVTNHHVATLSNAWIARLMQDEATFAMIEMLLATAAEGEEIPALADQLQAAKAEMDAMLAAEPMVIGVVKAVATENKMSMEVTMMDSMVMVMDIVMTETGLTADFAAMIPDEITAETTVAAIKEGTVPSTVLGLRYAIEGAAETAKVYVTSGGMTFAVNMNTNATNPDTDDQVVTQLVSLDLEMGEMIANMATFGAVTVIVDAPVLPDLNQMYVYDVFAMPTDMIINGIPQFVEKITAALPEVVQAITDAFTGMPIYPPVVEVTPGGMGNEIEDWSPVTPAETEEVEPAPVGGVIEDL